MAHCWLGLVVWIPGIPIWKGLLLRGIPIRIPNHRAPNHQLTISWICLWPKKIQKHAKKNPSEIGSQTMEVDSSQTRPLSLKIVAHPSFMATSHGNPACHKDSCYWIMTSQCIYIYNPYRIGRYQLNPRNWRTRVNWPLRKKCSCCYAYIFGLQSSNPQPFQSSNPQPFQLQSFAELPETTRFHG